MERLTDQLRERRDLPDEGLRELLESDDEDLVRHLHESAREVAESVFGRAVYLRALIEWSNVCRNDCLYCGIRKSNGKIGRYTLSHEEILQCCDSAFKAGLRTFVLQGGENPAAAEKLSGVIAEIKASWPSCAVTLSLGELPRETYALLRRSGADRYLLRHETADGRHYSLLHPQEMSLANRLDCLRTLKELGYQTGTGIMVGSPFQTTGTLIRDIRFIQGFRPEMIGIGPFVPQKDTPFGEYPHGSADLTLRLYSILRLMLPKALIPSTTALSTVIGRGRMDGILAGANVIMPVFTPEYRRNAYKLYEGKVGTDLSGQLDEIKQEMESIGYTLSPGRGDYNENL